MKNKKWLWFILAGIDVAITGFLFVIHVIMLANIIGKTPEQIQSDAAVGEGLVPELIRHLDLYLWAFVVPLFVILAVNIIVLVIYVRTKTKKEKVSVSDLSDEEKERLKQELLNDLNNGNK